MKDNKCLTLESEEMNTLVFCNSAEYPWKKIKVSKVCTKRLATVHSRESHVII